MTNDSKLFPPIEKWEENGFTYDGVLFWVRHGQHAIPVYNAKMFENWDFSSAGWVRGKGRGAVWEKIVFPKTVRPEYLMSVGDFLSRVEQRENVKICFKDISTAIHKRTMICAIVPDLPAVHASPVLRCNSIIGPEALQSALSSYVFDFVSKYKIGYLHLSYFIISECPLPMPGSISKVLPWLRRVGTALGCPHEVFAAHWIERRNLFSNVTWRRAWAASRHERLRSKAMLDAVIATSFGLDWDELKWILKDTDLPADFLINRGNTAQLNKKGFWRVDREKDPELRHTVLSLIAFHDLLEKGLEAFLLQNDGEGWMIPETLKLADYGLGHDERAKEHQPVACRLGPRFYDWQLNEDMRRSWEECAAHAELINRIVPTQFIEVDDATDRQPGQQVPLLL